MGTNQPSSADEEASFISALREGRRTFPPSSGTTHEPTSRPDTEVGVNDDDATRNEADVSSDRLYELSTLADLSIGDLTNAERRAFEVGVAPMYCSHFTRVDDNKRLSSDTDLIVFF